MPRRKGKLPKNVQDPFLASHGIKITVAGMRVTDAVRSRR